MKKQLVFGIVLGAIVLGLGFAGFARAVNNPIPGVDIIVCKNCIRITASDLGVDSVGMLPTSRFYFLKELGQGIRRFVTLGALDRAKFEFDITNHKAAELIGVTNACAPNAVGGGKHCTAGDISNAIRNFTKAQDRLNSRLAKVTAVYGWNQTAELTKQVDEKTSLHVGVLEQVAAFCRRMNLESPTEYLTLAHVVEDGLNNTLKTFTITVTATNDAPKKAADTIARAEEAVKQAETAFGQPVTFTATVMKDDANSALGDVSTTRGTAPSPVGVPFEGPFSAMNRIGGVDLTLTITHIPAGWAEFQPRKTSTDRDGFFGFTGLASGTYDLSVAGQHFTATVGTNRSIGGVVVTKYRRYRIDPARLEIDPLDDAFGKAPTPTPGGGEPGDVGVGGKKPTPAPTCIGGSGGTPGTGDCTSMTAAWPLQYSADVILIGPDVGVGDCGSTRSGSTAGTNAFPESCKDVQDNAIADTGKRPADGTYTLYVNGTAFVFSEDILALLANAKEHLADAKAIMANGDFVLTYGLARSAEAMVGAIRDTIWADTDIDRTAPTASPIASPSESPKAQTPTPSPKASPSATPTPERTETPKPTPSEHPTPTPTPSENPMGPASPTPTETGSPL